MLLNVCCNKDIKKMAIKELLEQSDKSKRAPASIGHNQREELQCLLFMLFCEYCFCRWKFFLTSSRDINENRNAFQARSQWSRLSVCICSVVFRINIMQPDRHRHIHSSAMRLKRLRRKIRPSTGMQIKERA